MKSPFVLIQVQSEGANRLAWFCSVVAALIVLILLCAAAVHQVSKGRYWDLIPILVTGLIFAPIGFLVVGYLVLGIAWIIEGFKKKDSK